ncbi:UPF0223 family protein [Oceanobacillus kimchii]|uniref:UPF0223 protein MACH08_16450 n=1 Tax=Oceanobacillus kimchii TaxID=746691 RepID=A0ABQ5TJE3_9BACI|nr:MULTISPECIES: UPF0223 family protein [Oceanobacillus]MCT1576411.1 UPF0223 family protein [Oceanobacillus kimchii]MCT2136047.1 UPF0223 family protein [Oceanobacillus kimchii]OEH54532.1 hypothetical protein AQ616_12295 [Oceanobacillus sp. E9]GLO65861.1 UPF0223 protein YktA [Oceanobacillus kimchii]
MSYQYPMDETWSTEEIIDVVNFFSLIEKAYEKQVDREEVLALYRRFKQIVPSKSEEKKLFSQFQEASGYSSYHVVKQARETNGSSIRM